MIVNDVPAMGIILTLCMAMICLYSAMICALCEAHKWVERSFVGCAFFMIVAITILIGCVVADVLVPAL